MTLLLLFLKNFLLTAAVEGGVLWCVRRDRRLLYDSLLCNLLTNPPANFLMLLGLSLWGEGAYWPLLFFLECAVVLAEAFVYRLLTDLSRSRAFLLSLLLNALSCASGLLRFLF